MIEENKQSQQPQTSSTTDTSEERDTAVLRSAWRDFFDEQERKGGAEPARK